MRERESRIAEDMAMMGDSSRWPDWPRLHLKTQPWVKPQEFGVLTTAAAHMVLVKGTDKIENYPSLRSLAERWSVD